MALFGKNKTDDISFESEGDFQKSLNTGAASSQSSAATTTTNHKPKANISYGIQDAIKLVRKLPNVNTDIVISVVIKTLESADIKVDEIVSDASQREARIEERSSTLIAKIEELESQITKLNKEITQLNSDLNETSTVKDLLLRSIAQDATQQQKAKPVQQQQKPAHDASSNNNQGGKPKDSISAAIDELALEKA